MSLVERELSLVGSASAQEETFKSMMRFPRNIKLHDLLHARAPAT